MSEEPESTIALPDPDEEEEDQSQEEDSGNNDQEEEDSNAPKNDVSKYRERLRTMHKKRVSSLFLSFLSYLTVHISGRSSKDQS